MDKKERNEKEINFIIIAMTFTVSLCIIFGLKLGLIYTGIAIVAVFVFKALHWFWRALNKNKTNQDYDIDIDDSDFDF